MAQVEYGRDNYNMCLCGGCPVNRSSGCVKDQEKALAPLIHRIEKQNEMPEKSVMPGIYCSVGKSVCADMDAAKSCLCPACSVLISEELKNSYYCLKGPAETEG